MGRTIALFIAAVTPPADTPLIVDDSETETCINIAEEIHKLVVSKIIIKL